MKKLLVPTDFSATANNALEYAIALANIFGSEITLLHTYRVYSSTGSFISVESFIQEDAANELLKIVRWAEPQLKNNATIVRKIIKGDTVDIVMDLTAHADYDLIIMGTKGTSGLAEIFIGSTTNSVIKNVALPVLAVPSGFAFHSIQNIVLAVDEKEVFNAELLSPVIQIAQNYNAMLRVYHKDVANDGLNAAVDQYLEGLERTYHYELDTDNINESINHFVAEYHADLLCMIRRQRSFLEEIFHDSVTTREVFSSPVPLLVLQGA